ncbi:MAG: glycoside hydrolase family protein [Actinomycetota bacterium]|nr:glycoside hydrolase family protein [Actinomycetota bacterium]
MRISDEGLALIAEFEGFVDHPYNDAAGHATIGFGHLLHHGPVTAEDRRRWGKMSHADGLKLLRSDIRSRERAVDAAVKVPLTQNQFDALVSFVYNLGEGALRQSTLLKKLNAGNYDAVPAELAKWNKAGGRVLPGLVRRRKAEAARWRSGGDPLAGLTPTERRWAREYDRLKREDRDRPRRAELRRAMQAQRERIEAAARESGWDSDHRRERFEALRARTS